MTTVNLEEIEKGLDEFLRGWAAEYAPEALAWGVARFDAWKARLLAGDVYGAAGEVFEQHPGSDEAADWAAVNAGWDNLNEAQKARLAKLKLATDALIVGLAKLGLGIIAAMVGL